MNSIFSSFGYLLVRTVAGATIYNRKFRGLRTEIKTLPLTPVVLFVGIWAPLLLQMHNPPYKPSLSESKLVNQTVLGENG
ncbi:hypothetical protein QVD17_09870 [Tagetes erecta]|uniref:Uncharacterized protein n=1 Tax=Tagetes erecta TaxID=13708 RepID=A0AAD8L1D1_TARER|nr:hypothetical protein QVD17_09870 [Tagetes erecta]